MGNIEDVDTMGGNEVVVAVVVVVVVLVVVVVVFDSIVLITVRYSKYYNHNSNFDLVNKRVKRYVFLSKYSIRVETSFSTVYYNV